MVSDDAGNPSLLDVTDERARQAQRSEYAIAALDWLFDHDFLGPHAIAAIIGLVTVPGSLSLLSAVGDLPVIERSDPVIIPMSSDTPMCHAARLGVATCLATIDDIRRASPWLASVAPAARAAVTFPIGAPGRSIGAIGVTYSEPIADGEQVLDRLALISESLAASLRTLLLPATSGDGSEPPDDQGPPGDHAVGR